MSTVTPGTSDRSFAHADTLEAGFLGPKFLDRIGLSALPWSTCLHWNAATLDLNMDFQTAGPVISSNDSLFDIVNLPAATSAQEADFLCLNSQYIQCSASLVKLRARTVVKP